MKQTTKDRMSKARLKPLEIGVKNNDVELLNDLGMRYRPGHIFKEGVRNKKVRYGNFLCHCGNNFISAITEVKNGKIRSCGCLQRKAAILNIKEENERRGASFHGESETRLYRIFNGMKTRCYNQNHHSYVNYGGRRVTICEEWLDDYQVFRTWALDNGYRENLSIDRIDFDGNYKPGNCRWVTQEVQANNQRLRKDNKTGYKGISKRGVVFVVDHKGCYIGTYDDIETAILVKDALTTFSSSKVSS